MRAGLDRHGASQPSDRHSYVFSATIVCCRVATTIPRKLHPSGRPGGESDGHRGKLGNDLGVSARSWAPPRGRSGGRPGAARPSLRHGLSQGSGLDEHRRAKHGPGTHRTTHTRCTDCRARNSELYEVEPGQICKRPSASDIGAVFPTMREDSLQSCPTTRPQPRDGANFRRCGACLAEVGSGTGC